MLKISRRRKKCGGYTPPRKPDPAIDSMVCSLRPSMVPLLSLKKMTSQRRKRAAEWVAHLVRCIPLLLFYFLDAERELE